MKRFWLLAVLGTALTGCVSEYPDYGSSYDPYRGEYERRSGRIYQERYRPELDYRDYRASDREFYRNRDRGYRRDYDRYDRQEVRRDRAREVVQPANERPYRGNSNPAGTFNPRIVTGQLEGTPRASRNGRRTDEEQTQNPANAAGTFNPRIVTGQLEGGVSSQQMQNGGPRPYRPPVPGDN